MQRLIKLSSRHIPVLNILVNELGGDDITLTSEFVQGSIPYSRVSIIKCITTEIGELRLLTVCMRMGADSVFALFEKYLTDCNIYAVKCDVII